ncbi:MAG: hypothetical protein KDB82_15360 [Planctomycetes bacterium]|nr:hypothetical protein [Planctomycetota bacterium]
MRCQKLVLVALIAVAAPVLAAQSEAALLRKNLDAAEDALKHDKYEDALLSVQAALKLSPYNQRARVIEMDVYDEQGKTLLAMDAALKAFDASKLGDRDASKNTKKVYKYVKKQSPTLAEFLDARSDAVGGLLKLRKRAVKDDLPGDAEWLAKTARVVFPTDADLEELAGAGVPRFHEIKVEPGMAPLLDDPKAWVFYNGGDGSYVKDGVLTLKQDEDGRICDAGYRLAKLKKDFKLSFKFKYKRREGGMDPHISVLFTDAAEVPDTTAVHSFGIDPWGRKRIVLAFNKPREGTGWKELGASELPEGTMPEGEWAEAVVLWDSGDRTVSLDLNGKRMADRTLDAGEELGHYFHLGVGSGNEIEVKELFAKLADEDK